MAYIGGELEEGNEVAGREDRGKNWMRKEERWKGEKRRRKKEARWTKRKKERERERERILALSPDDSAFGLASLASP